MWNTVTEYLLERFEEPTLVLDPSGRVLALNAALERLLGWTRSEVIGRPWTELSPADSDADKALAWLSPGVQGISRRVEMPARTGEGRAVTLIMNVAHLGGGDERAAVATVIASRAREPSSMPYASNDEYYEISARASSRGLLRYVWTTRNADASHVGQPCYAAFYERQEPCLGCPAFVGGQPGEVRTGVVRFGDNGESFGLVTAEFGDMRVHVSVRRIARSEVSELVRARIDLLAENGGLSSRERSVLELLIEGKSADDIGDALGISPRTAKFHQTNILQKLGVDSRLDLFRLVVE